MGMPIWPYIPGLARQSALRRVGTNRRKRLGGHHGAVFSERKQMFIKSQTVLVGRGIAESPYNDRWWAILLLRGPSLVCAY